MPHFLIVSLFIALVTVICLVVRNVRNKSYNNYKHLRRCNFTDRSKYRINFRHKKSDPFFSLVLTYDDSKSSFVGVGVTLPLQMCRQYFFIEITEVTE